MELFPAQPDLSLQISLPIQNNNKPTSEEMDMGFWKRALDSRNYSSISSPVNNTNSTSCFDLSLSNPPIRVPLSHDPNSNTHFHDLLLQNTTNNNHLIFNHQNYGHYQNHYDQHQQKDHHHQGGGLMRSSSDELMGFLRPIRGIPIYPQQNPHLNFPFATSAAAQKQTSPLDSTNPSPQTHNHQVGLMRSRFLSRFLTKRSMRAPRMRWTTTLHARFVHAVELLGGHESK